MNNQHQMSLKEAKESLNFTTVSKDQNMMGQVKLRHKDRSALKSGDLSYMQQ